MLGATGPGIARDCTDCPETVPGEPLPGAGVSPACAGASVAAARRRDAMPSTRASANRRCFNIARLTDGN